MLHLLTPEQADAIRRERAYRAWLTLAELDPPTMHERTLSPDVAIVRDAAHAAIADAAR